LRPHGTNVALGTLTVVYGVGQIAGPLLAVRVTLATGAYRDALLAAAALLVAAVAIFAWRPSAKANEIGVASR
jgi:cyanate permease